MNSVPCGPQLVLRGEREPLWQFVPIGLDAGPGGGPASRAIGTKMIAEIFKKSPLSFKLWFDQFHEKHKIFKTFPGGARISPKMFLRRIIGRKFTRRTDFQLK